MRIKPPIWLREIQRRGWTQQQAATFFGVNQPRISDLVKGRIERFTVDMLVNWLEKLGKDVALQFVLISSVRLKRCALKCSLWAPKTSAY
jgi:predicted XRE-type DNA-binding protein